MQAGGRERGKEREKEKIEAEEQEGREEEVQYICVFLIHRHQLFSS